MWFLSPSWRYQNRLGHDVLKLSGELKSSQEVRLLVRNSSLCDASADISVGGMSLGKWLITCEPNAPWHNIACNYVFKFQSSYSMSPVSRLRLAN